MPALNYQARFAPMVESGAKRQTIRAVRKRPIKEGDRLYHFTGMRTKACKRLREKIADYCYLAIDITITESSIKIPRRYREGYGLRPEIVAMADGFYCFTEMVRWFEKTHGLPFQGQLIRW